MATATFGGFAPFIATWLISYTGSPLAPTFYVILTAVISLATAISLRETAHEPLK
jgi:MHS family proline/betaine transporter-like MFS transporter